MSELCWRPQNVREGRAIECLLGIAVQREWKQYKKQIYLAESKYERVE